MRKGCAQGRAQPLTVGSFVTGLFAKIDCRRLLLRPAHHYAGVTGERGCIAAPAAAGAFWNAKPLNPQFARNRKGNLRVPRRFDPSDLKSQHIPVQLEAIGLQTANEDMTTISISAVTSALFTATWLSI